MLDDRLKELIACIFQTQEEEIDPETWDIQFEEVAERAARGENILDIMPSIAQYLANAPDCREEYRAVVAMLQAEMTDEPEDV